MLGTPRCGVRTAQRAVPTLHTDETSASLRWALRALAKNRQNFVRGLRAGKTLAHRAVVQEFRNRCQCAQMCLKLIFRNDEQNDEFHCALSSASNSIPFVDLPKAATTSSSRSDEQCGMAMPKPMPVLIVSSR